MSDEQEARVTRCHGRRVWVLGEVGEEHLCVVKGRQLRPVCGDVVTWRPQKSSHEGLVTAIGARHNELARPDSRGRIQVLAANLDRLVIVSSMKPAVDAGLIDRYIAAAELARMDSAVVLNKCDLDEGGEVAARVLPEYEVLGYACHRTRAKAGEMDDLEATLATGTSALVGLSGTGKSTLLNHLVPEASQTVGEISAATDAGRHTTTASAMYPIGKGWIVDSPGVRDYAPPPVEPERVADGFVEIRRLADHCRFRDCLHRSEPDCAVRDEVGGGVSERRYKSYLHLLKHLGELRREF
jgi:ribosome biogenesis GTPase / thiamine phosphate phosphatase